MAADLHQEFPLVWRRSVQQDVQQRSPDDTTSIVRYESAPSEVTLEFNGALLSGTLGKSLFC